MPPSIDEDALSSLDGTSAVSSTATTSSAVTAIIAGGGNSNSVPFRGMTLLELFRNSVKRHPNRVAVVSKGISLTYAQLDARSSIVASKLRLLGVGVDTKVGLLVKRSVHMVVGMVAVVKCRGGYVPMDPRYPQDRLEFMLEASDCSVILSDAESVGAISGSQYTGECTVIMLDELDYAKLPTDMPSPPPRHHLQTGGDSSTCSSRRGAQESPKASCSSTSSWSI